MASPDAPVNEVEALRKQIADLQIQLKQKTAAESGLIAPYSKSYSRVPVRSVLQADGEGASLAGQTLRVGGWVKTGREAGAGAFAFLEINDGSCFANLQVMVDKAVAESVGGLGQLTPTSTCVLIEGILSETPPGTKQKVELKASKIVHLGTTDAAEYPLAKKKQSFEFLREKAHLRPRTNTIGAVARIRNALATATHTFFQSHGFLYVNCPIITASDCEGAGEMFQVTTLLSGADGAAASPAATPEELEALRAEVAAQGEAVKAAKAAAAADKADKSLAAESKAQVGALLALKQRLAGAEERARLVGGVPHTPSGGIDYSKDFFGRAAFLTVSSQLNAEYYACALTSVYTFGPTFRAENSHTARHLAEFWMIEPELAFADLADDMRCAEDYVRFCCRWLLDHAAEDMAFIDAVIDKGASERLRAVAAAPFARVSYTEAVRVLEEVVASKKKKFEFPVSWGVDLQSEHERYLTEEVYKAPIIVYDYPKDIKAFYMRLNDDGRTVAAMDVLVPRVGELIGGSQREERRDVLQRRIQESGMPLEPYAPYLDLRTYGTVPHSGFGLGFERLVLFATGLDNIREVMPFPRWPGHAEF
ncbi:TSN1 [Auxenochlorella protothecoides x Auxenochlorella symbiontica]